MIQSAPGPAGWFSVWIKVVTRPNEQTFVEITERSDANMKTAFIWIFIAGTVSGIFQAISRTIALAFGVTPQLPIPGFEQFQQAPVSSDPGSLVSSLVVSICTAPIAGLVSVLFFAIGVAITLWIAKLFGGVGTFDKLSYAIAAISVPFSLVVAVLSLFSVIPFVGLCTSVIILVLSLYTIFLQITAVKAVNQIGWGAAIGTVLLPAVVIGFVCGCLVIGGLTLLGPVIGNVFSSINQSLAP
jgi:hypothetical protein